LTNVGVSDGCYISITLSDQQKHYQDDPGKDISTKMLAEVGMS